ncbi:hypothetical protein LTR74_017890 [Friedmanniomyces endolithicus]|nr:hypothetical protein LTR74_017890 [Friedmanniomyces endolithicus]
MPDTLHGNTPASSLRPEPAMVEHLRERLNELDENIDLEDFEDCRRFHVEFGALTGDDYNRLDMFMSSIPKDFPYDLTMPSQQTNDQTELRYFQSSLWRDQKLDASRVGVNKLKTFLQALLDRHIEKELPKTAHTGFASAAYIGHARDIVTREFVTGHQAGSQSTRSIHLGMPVPGDLKPSTKTIAIRSPVEAFIRCTLREI